MTVRVNRLKTAFKYKIYIDIEKYNANLQMHV